MLKMAKKSLFDNVTFPMTVIITYQIIERSQKSVTLDFSKIDKKTDRVDFERGYLLTDS